MLNRAPCSRRRSPGVTPLDQDRVHHEPPPPPSRVNVVTTSRSFSASSLSDVAPPHLALEGSDEATYLKPGMTSKTLRDLRRGRWLVQAHLDLHGMQRDEARHQVSAFLSECLALGHRCARIVHGKGLGLAWTYPDTEKTGAGLADTTPGSARLLPGTRRGRRRGRSCRAAAGATLTQKPVRAAPIRLRPCRSRRYGCERSARRAGRISFHRRSFLCAPP